MQTDVKICNQILCEYIRTAESFLCWKHLAACSLNLLEGTRQATYQRGYERVPIIGDTKEYPLEGIRKSTHQRGYERVPIRGDTKEYPLEGMRTITHKRESQRLQIRRDVKDYSKDISLQILWNTSQTHFISSSRYTLLH